MLPLVALVGERRHRGPAMRHAAAWTAALALAVSVAWFASGAAFVWSLAGGGSARRGTVRVPLDGGGEHSCLRAGMARRSYADLLVPSAFPGLAVSASACFVRALAVGRRHDEY